MKKMPNFVSIGLFRHPLLAKNPNCAVFWTSAFSVVANWQQSGMGVCCEKKTLIG